MEVQKDQSIDKITIIGTEISGFEFNQMYHTIKLVKLTNATENHNGYQFVEGLNEDTNEFFPFGKCKAGGIYFTEEKYSYKWLHYKNSVGIMKYMRLVTIPNDARVYIEKRKFKADKIILGSKQDIDPDIYVKAVKNLYTKSKTITTNDLYMQAITHYGKVLKYIPILAINRNMCMMAVKQNGHALKYTPINLMNVEVCIEAIKNSGDSLKYIPEHKRNKEMYMEAIKSGHDIFEQLPINMIDDDMYNFMIYHGIIQWMIEIHRSEIYPNDIIENLINYVITKYNIDCNNNDLHYGNVQYDMKQI